MIKILFFIETNQEEAMKIKRSSGILMHITSLSGDHGIGTLGKEAYEFVDLLKEGGQKYWQTLPLGPTAPTFGYSPYSSYSSFAGNYLFINLEMLQKEEWMRTYIMSELPAIEYNDFVDFDKITTFKIPLLKKACENFYKYAGEKTRQDFNQFCKSAGSWLEDYTLYMAIAEHYNNFDWLTWSEEIRLRTPVTIKEWREKLKSELNFHTFVQYIFSKQWHMLKKYANENGIKIIGDIPIYVNFDSADVWSNPRIFQLDEKTFKPTAIAGVPPDYFSLTGQRWGNPLYKWFRRNRLNRETIDWWIKRISYTFKYFDIVRLDHFRGFESYWSIPVSEPTAVNGQWNKGPGLDFFKKLKQELGELYIIAEDLGVITPQVVKLRDQLDLPGMKILQFAFDFNNKNAYLPHNYSTSNCIVYTGTHDNNTTNGWFYENEVDENTREYILRYLRVNHRDEFHWQLISLALSSIAKLSIFPVQDILGYAGKFRMNTPGKARDNWSWKLTPGRLTPEIMHRLKKLCVLYNRA
jgi:4-alpha-glucanotransferase